MNSSYDRTNTSVPFSREVLFLAFSFLNVKDLLNVELVCKEWHLCVSHDSFWKAFEDRYDINPGTTDTRGTRSMVISYFKCVKIIENLITKPKEYPW